MAMLVLCLTAAARDTLYKVLLVLCSLSCSVSSFYIVWVLICHIRHAFLLHDFITALFEKMYLALIPVGVLLLLVSIVGLKVTWNTKKQPINHSLPRTQTVWALFLAMSCAVAALGASAMSDVSQSLQDQLIPRLKHGLSRYSFSAEWQNTLDRVQGELGCCGVHSYTDWYTTSWLPLSAITTKIESSVYSKMVQPNGRLSAPLVPTSCCINSSTNQCGHLAWLRDPHGSPTPSDPSTLHLRGCVDAIQNLVTRDLMYFKVLLLAIVVLQVSMLVCFRYLYTSSFNSLVLGRPRGKAPGWFAGPCTQLWEEDKKCYPDNIVHRDSIERVGAKRKTWKCFKKFQGRSEKDPDSDDSSPKSKRKLFRSNCLSKLKLRRKKNKELEEVTEMPSTEKDLDSQLQALTSDAQEEEESSEEREFIAMKRVGSSLSGHQCDDNVKKSSQISKGKLSDGQNNHHLRNESPQRKKTMSKGLIDLEGEPHNPGNPINKEIQKLDIFETKINQNSPFLRELGQKINKPSDTENLINFDVLLPNETVIKKRSPRKQSFEMGVDRDFKKTRSLFESTPGLGRNEKFDLKTRKINQAEIPINANFGKNNHSKNEGFKHNSYSKNDEESSPIALKNYFLPENNIV